ncbi:hypothetical protein ACX93W_25750 [Paenibacillus sp. CAU 1782]
MRENRCIHMTKEQLRAYAGGGIGLAERAATEEKLAVCERCLEMWIEVMENSESLPEQAAGYPDMAQLEDRVIGKLMEERLSQADPQAALLRGDCATGERREGDGGQRVPLKAPRKTRSRFSLLQNPIAQYGIAASITLLLMTSGILGGVAGELVKLDEIRQEEMPYLADKSRTMEPTWSERMITRAGAWLDDLQQTRFK